MTLLKKFPLAISGLILAMLTLGNMYADYSQHFKWLIGGPAIILYITYLLKLIFDFQSVKADLHKSLVASSFPTIAMATIVLSSYLKNFSNGFANIFWYAGIIFYIFYIPFFTKRFLKKFDINKLFAAWYIVYVGVAVAGIVVKVSENYLLGELSFWFGLIMFLAWLPFILYRCFFINNFSNSETPSLIVLAAPASLLFLSYYNSVFEKNYVLMYMLFILSQLFYFLALSYLPRIFKNVFYPTISATTFPMVTGAFVSKLMFIYTQYSLLNYLYYLQFIFASGVVLFVLYSYLKFLLKYN